MKPEGVIAINSEQEFARDAAGVLNQATDAEGMPYVFYLDITDFQSVNHYYGVKAGDRLLDTLAARLPQCPGVLLSRRIRSDQFLCLSRAAPGTGEAPLLSKWARRISGFLEREQPKYPASKLGLACGCCRVESGNLLDAIDGANFARKEAKRQGAARPVLYDEEMRNAAADRLEKERALEQALKEERFCYYLQPKVDLTTGNIVGAEALARRLNEDGEVIHPDAFLPLMEESGAVVELDRLICRQVCRDLSKRRKQGLPVTPTSVNLSRLHTNDPDAADKLHAIVSACGLPPELLEFELTETILLDEFSGAKRLIGRLRGYGYHVSIDDFGSGYAGINVWQELDFDCLKLDRKFLAEEEPLKQRNEALVPNIINIGQRLNIQVLCEGVETPEQCRYLLRLGCTQVQGFFFSRPAPPEEFYRVYREQGGRYALSFRQERARPVADSGCKGRLRCPAGLRGHLLAVAFCLAVLCLGIAGTATYNRILTQREFTDMVLENLSVYTDTQCKSVQAVLEDLYDTLEALRVLGEQNGDTASYNDYLQALNAEHDGAVYSFTPYAEGAENTPIRPEDVNILQRLKAGERVVTDITFSNRMGGIYCVAVGVPVFRDGAFCGAVRGVIDAAVLLETPEYPPAQGKIVGSFLTDSGGNILRVRPGGLGGNLFDILDERGVGGEDTAALRETLAAGGETAVIYLNTPKNLPVYLSVADLGVNDWHLVLCLQADSARVHSQHIIRNTQTTVMALLLLFVLPVFGTLTWILRGVHRQMSMDERRYLLLEQFTDTVLFDYDCRRDVLHLTRNAAGLLHAHGLAQEHFMAGLRGSSIYAGDHEAVRAMLSGAVPEESGEIRIRLRRPDADEYFWCMLQYQYTYERGVLVSVTGKITDIDAQKRREEQLRQKSETDALTGLRSRGEMERQIAARLRESGAGLLFLLDIDNFKQINDSYGHSVGDKVLRYVAACMGTVFREGDILGRLGGDELMAYIGGVDDPELARKKAERLLSDLEESDEFWFPVSLSVGIALYPDHGQTYEELYRAADQAMYRAKQGGKNRCCIAN